MWDLGDVHLREVDEESWSQHMAPPLTIPMDILSTYAHSIEASVCCRLRILGSYDSLRHHGASTTQLSTTDPIFSNSIISQTFIH